MINLTTLVNNDVKLLITIINLTCIIKLKIYISWNKTLFDNRIRVIVPHVANLSYILKDIYRLGITVSCGFLDKYLRIHIASYPDWYRLKYYWETLSLRLRCIWIDRDWSIIEKPWVWNWGVSGLIETEVLLRNLEFEIEVYV